MRDDGFGTGPSTAPLRIGFICGHGLAWDDMAAVDELASRLLARGDALFVLSGEGQYGDTMRVVSKAASDAPLQYDTVSGYPHFRSLDPAQALSDFLDETMLDIAVLQGDGAFHLAKHLHRAGTPMVIHVRDGDLQHLGNARSVPPNAALITGSIELAQRLRAESDLQATVVAPIVPSARYRVAKPGTHVTAFDPHLDEVRGLLLFLAARCRHIPFLLQETDPLSPKLRHKVEAEIAPHANLCLAPPTADPRTTYAQTGLLLALGAEADPLRIARAHASGIPVLGADTVDLAEAIGPGGQLVQTEASTKAWAEALDEIWGTPHRYDSLKDGALRHAMRPERDPDRQLALFRAVLTRTLSAV